MPITCITLDGARGLICPWLDDNVTPGLRAVWQASSEMSGWQALSQSSWMIPARRLLPTLQGWATGQLRIITDNRNTHYIQQRHPFSIRINKLTQGREANSLNHLPGTNLAIRCCFFSFKNWQYFNSLWCGTNRWSSTLTLSKPSPAFSACHVLICFLHSSSQLSGQKMRGTFDKELNFVLFFN